jgi:type II secretory pathway component PulF
VALAGAFAAFILLVLVLEWYVPSQAAALADSGQPLPFSTRLAIVVSQFLVRFWPFLVVVGLPILGLLGVGAVLVVVLARSRPQLARRVVIGLVTLTCIELCVSGLIAYVMRV